MGRFKSLRAEGLRTTEEQNGLTNEKCTICAGTRAQSPERAKARFSRRRRPMARFSRDLVVLRGASEVF